MSRSESPPGAAGPRSGRGGPAPSGGRPNDVQLPGKSRSPSRCAFRSSWTPRSLYG